MTAFTNTVTDFVAEFRHDRFFRWATGMHLVTQIACFILLLLVWQKLPPVVPLHYSVPWGEEQLVSPMSLVLLIAASFLLYIANTLGALFLFKKSSYLSHMLLCGTTAVTLFVGFTIVQTIFLVN